jgi:hypothetical protein
MAKGMILYIEGQDKADENVNGNVLFHVSVVGTKLGVTTVRLKATTPLKPPR